MVFHGWKGKLDWIQVRRVGRQEFTAHPPTHWLVHIYETKQENSTLPGFNELNNIRMLVDTAIIHHNDRICNRERLHLVQQPFNKPHEGLCTKRTCNYITVHDTIVKRERRENWEALWPSVMKKQHIMNLLSTTYKECFTLHLCSSNGPGMATIGCSAVNRAFVNKNQLFCFIFCYPSKILKVFLCRPFCCNTCNLGEWGCSSHNMFNTCKSDLKLTFFIVNPALRSVLHTVAREMLTPQDIASISWSSSR